MGDGTRKALAAVAAVVVLGGAAWLALRTEPAPVPAPVPPVPMPARAASPAPPPQVPTASPKEGSGDPGPVNLSKCDRDLDLFGVVVDGSDAPVAGATLQVEVYPWQAVHNLNAAHYRDMVPGLSTRSAADGTFRLRLRRGESVCLRVRKEGLAERFLSHCLAGERLKVVLARGADLVVLVSDENGTPVKDARLRLWRMLPNYGREIERTGTTDEQGRFVFDALTPGRAYLSVEADGHVLPNWAQPEIKANETVTVEVRFPPARILEGTVKDAVTGAPIAGARVGIGWTMEFPVATDADGRYRMEQWAPKQGRPDLHARAEGYVGLGINVLEEGEVDFLLRPGDSVTGRFVDAAGRPVPGAMVSVNPPDRNAPPPPGSQPFDYLAGTVDAEGRFLLRGLDHSVEYHSLVATAEGHGRLLLEFPPPSEEGGTADLGDLAFPPARAIEGVVLDTDGKPAAGVGVSARGAFPDRGRRLPGGTPLGARPGRGTMDFRRTDDLGRFRFAELSPGPWTLTARLEGSPEIEKSVVLPPDQDLLDVRLGSEATGLATLTVFVVTEAGDPVEGAPVMLAPEGKSPLHKDSNARGMALFRGLERKRHNLQVSIYGASMKDFISDSRIGEWVTPADQEVRVVLRQAAEVRGIVVDADGNPLPRMEVDAYLEEEREKWHSVTFADERGEFVMKTAAGSPLRLSVPGKRSVPRDPKADPRMAVMPEPTPLRGEVPGVIAPAAGVRIVAAEPKRDRWFQVLVLDPDGRPVSGVRVVGHGTGGQNIERRTDAAGKARFENLLPDRIQILVLFDPDAANALPEDAVPPALQWVEPAGQTLTMRCTTGVVLSGKVLLPDGRPAGGARVSAFLPEKGINRTVVADGEGLFRLAALPGEKPHVSASLFPSDGTVLIGFAESVDPAAGAVEIRLAPKGK